MISDQFSGLNAITVPGTLRDSMVLLPVVLEQQTELQPRQIMTDTGAYSDIVFGIPAIGISLQPTARRCGWYAFMAG